MEYCSIPEEKNTLDNFVPIMNDLLVQASSSNDHCFDDGRILRPRLQDVTYGEVDDIGYLTDESDLTGRRFNKNGVTSSKNELAGDFRVSFDVEDAEEAEEKTIMIGAEYQAVVPDILSKKARGEEELNYTDTSICTWMPPDKLSDEKVDKYVKLALEAGGDNYPYTVEQVLGILYCCDYRTGVALEALQEYSPESEGWTFEEKIIFEQALEKHGKNFQRIVEDMFPQKPVGSIIKRYYERKARTMNKYKKITKVVPETSQEVKKEQIKPTTSVDLSVKLKPNVLLTDLAPKIRQTLLQKVQKMLWEKKSKEPVVITIDED
ncbi:unnamed protein product [Allacma fusca]|uniref:Uncharacterized protein n=1 Tax=Allacma fusca TaxID=39272 RepID=A0A8J2KW54_9HEXA|nr:unnamed protein product [Allacma fusca]